MQTGGMAEQPISPTNLGDVSPLHAACRVSRKLHVQRVDAWLGALLRPSKGFLGLGLGRGACALHSRQAGRPHEEAAAMSPY
jgi:hypothetical protein